MNIALLSLLIVCGPAPAAGDSWRAQLDRAEGAEDGARLSEMERRLAAIESKDFEEWLVLGTILREEGKPRAAEDALRKALALKPDDPSAENALAQAYDDMDRFEEEIVPLKKAIERNPRGYSSYARLANVYIRLGRPAEAKETFALARKIDGKAARAYIDEGYFDLNSGEPARAKEDFESAVAVDTSSPFGYHHLGAYYATNQQYPEAEKYFRRALERLEADPKTRPEDLLHALDWLGRVVRAQGRSAEAEAIYRRCLEKPAPGPFYFMCARSLGDMYDSQEKPALAEETLQRAATACEGGPACSCRGRTQAVLGSFYLKHGRRREASDMADRAAKSCAGYHDSFDALIFSELEGLYERLGDASKEDELHGRVMAARSSIFFSAVLPDTAERDMKRGRFGEAEDLYRQGIRVFNHRGDGRQEAAMLDGLAAACEKEGKPHEAAEASEKANALRARP